MPLRRNIVRRVLPVQYPVSQVVIRDASLRILLMKSIREMIETQNIIGVDDEQLKHAIDVVLNIMEETGDDDEDDDVRLGNRLTRFLNGRTLFTAIIDEIRRQQQQQPQQPQQPQQQHSGRRRSSKARKARKSRKSRNTRRK